MANTPQSKKRARQTLRRTEVNKARRSRIRTFLRKVEEAIASGNADAAQEALKAAQPELMRGVSKGGKCMLRSRPICRSKSTCPALFRRSLPRVFCYFQRLSLNFLVRRPSRILYKDRCKSLVPILARDNLSMY